MKNKYIDITKFKIKQFKRGTQVNDNILEEAQLRVNDIYYSLLSQADYYGVKYTKQQLTNFKRFFDNNISYEDINSIAGNYLPHQLKKDGTVKKKYIKPNLNSMLRTLANANSNLNDEGRELLNKYRKNNKNKKGMKALKNEYNLYKRLENKFLEINIEHYETDSEILFEFYKNSSKKKQLEIINKIEEKGESTNVFNIPIKGITPFEGFKKHMNNNKIKVKVIE